MAEKPAHNLNPKQEEVILALLAHLTVTKASETTGVPERTIYNWLEDREFAREYRRARRTSYSQSMAAISRLVSLAINTLAKVMTDASAGHSAKVSAASAALRTSREVIDNEDLAERIETLEQQFKDQKERGTP